MALQSFTKSGTKLRFSLAVAVVLATGLASCASQQQRTDTFRSLELPKNKPRQAYGAGTTANGSTSTVTSTTKF